MFFVADQPDMSLQTLREFLRCLEGQGCRLACLTDGLHPGNPCVFHRSLIPELQALTGDRGGRALFAAHPHEVYQHLVCDPSQLRDVDFKVHP